MAGSVSRSGPVISSSAGPGCTSRSNPVGPGCRKISRRDEGPDCPFGTPITAPHCVAALTARWPFHMDVSPPKETAGQRLFWHCLNRHKQPKRRGPNHAQSPDAAPGTLAASPCQPVTLPALSISDSHCASSGGWPWVKMTCGYCRAKTSSRLSSMQRTPAQRGRDPGPQTLSVNRATVPIPGRDSTIPPATVMTAIRRRKGRISLAAAISVLQRAGGMILWHVSCWRRLIHLCDHILQPGQTARTERGRCPFGMARLMEQPPGCRPAFRTARQPWFRSAPAPPPGSGPGPAGRSGYSAVALGSWPWPGRPPDTAGRARCS